MRRKKYSLGGLNEASTQFSNQLRDKFKSNSLSTRKQNFKSIRQIYKIQQEIRQILQMFNKIKTTNIKTHRIKFSLRIKGQILWQNLHLLSEPKLTIKKICHTNKEFQMKSKKNPTGDVKKGNVIQTKHFKSYYA